MGKSIWEYSLFLALFKIWKIWHQICNSWHKTCNMQHATFHIKHAIYHVKTCDVDVKHEMDKNIREYSLFFSFIQDMQHLSQTCNIWRQICNNWCKTCNLQHFMSNIQHTTHNMKRWCQTWNGQEYSWICNTLGESHISKAREKYWVNKEWSTP